MMKKLAHTMNYISTTELQSLIQLKVEILNTIGAKRFLKVFRVCSRLFLNLEIHVQLYNMYLCTHITLP